MTENDPYFCLVLVSETEHFFYGNFWVCKCCRVTSLFINLKLMEVN